MIKIITFIRSCGGSFTCEPTFAGVSCGQGLDVVWGVGNLISSILDGDGVGARRVRYVGHSVGSVSVVLDSRLFRLSLWILSAFVYQERSYMRGLLRFRSWESLGGKSRSRTNQNLHGEQPLSGIAGIDGELHGKTCSHAFGVKSRTTGTHLASIVPGQRHYLEWAVNAERDKNMI